jgi:hypothetical protein
LQQHQPLVSKVAMVNLRLELSRIAAVLVLIKDFYQT